MLDSSIIGKVVDYGKYLCVVDSILDYKEGIIQLRITKGKYDGFRFSIGAWRITETYDGLILYVDIKRTPTLGDIVEFNEMLWKVINTNNNVITIENDGWSCSYSIHDMDKKNHFKGMVLHKDKLIAVLDIRDFLNEEIVDDGLSNIVLVEYDKDNIEHCIGILVSSLEEVCVVEEKTIQHIQNHFLGAGTLVESLVNVDDSKDSKVAMLLDIKKIDTNLTKRI